MLSCFIKNDYSSSANFKSVESYNKFYGLNTTSDWDNILYNKTKMYAIFNTMLKEIDKEYRTTLVNFAKYHIIMFAMAKIMEMEQSEKNKMTLYLFNNIKI